MNNNSKGGGVGLVGVVLVVFIILKLCGLIHWSWIWVLSPLWISLSIVVVIFIIAMIIAIVSWIRVSKQERK